MNNTTSNNYINFQRNTIIKNFIYIFFSYDKSTVLEWN